MRDISGGECLKQPLFQKLIVRKEGSFADRNQGGQLMKIRKK